jgi:prepilin-type processing-associated H-X9-DG protein
MTRSLPVSLLIATALAVLAAPSANASVHGTGGGGGAGKVHYSDLSVMISLEKASPQLRHRSGSTGTGKTMAADVLASTLALPSGANVVMGDGSVRFIRR